MANKYEELGTKIGQLVDEKDAAYGSSFSKSGDFVRLLWPNGCPPENYDDLLTLIRIFDKMMRIATRKNAFGESPYKDMAGYSILGAARDAGLVEAHNRSEENNAENSKKYMELTKLVQDE